MTRRHLAVGLVMAFLGQASAGAKGTPPPSAVARAERTTVKLGEPFHLSVEVRVGDAARIELPAALPLGEDLAETGRTELGGGKTAVGRRVFDLTMVAYKLGKLTVPALPILVTPPADPPVATQPIEIEVLSVVGEGEATLRPIAPPVSVLQRDLGLVRVGVGIAAALAMALTIWLVIRAAVRRKRLAAARAIAEVARPCDEVALERLRALAASPLLTVDDRRPFYFALTDVLREYLGRRYGFEALELTTSELLVALGERGDSAVRPDIEAWLTACDLVKFANVRAPRAEADAALAQAFQLVESTRPRPEPPASVQASPPATLDGGEPPRMEGHA